MSGGAGGLRAPQTEMTKKSTLPLPPTVLLGIVQYVLLNGPGGGSAVPHLSLGASLDLHRNDCGKCH